MSKPTAVILAVILLLTFAYISWMRVPQGTNVGDLAMEIAGRDIDGVGFKLSDYRGKVVVLDFWGDW